MSNLPARLAAATAILCAALTGAACTEETSELHLENVPLPAGGSAESITLVRGGERSHLVVPAGEAVFSRATDRRRWKRHRVDWPEGWKQTAGSPLHGMRRLDESFTFPAGQRFTSHAGSLWMLTDHPPSNERQLLVSGDRGVSWSTAPLPERHRAQSEPGASSNRSDLSRADARVPLRIRSRPEGLFLLGKQHVWAASPDDDGDIDEWRRIDLSGVGLLGASASVSLPSVVRNYLPATERRPFELLTVYADRLYVYRRTSSAERWLLVSTLPTIDLDLYAPSGTETLYLLAPEALYRSRARGERWEKSALVDGAENPPQNRAAAFFRGPDAPERAPPAVLVGTRAGSIYRSTDGGTSWIRTRNPDPDGRSITGFVAESGSERIWAATDGSGVLRSSDAGRTWSPSNERFRATRPLAVATGLNDEPIVGTRAGLFRSTGAPTEGHWDPLHDRAASAVAVDRERARTITGTLGGSLVTDPGTGEPIVSDPLPANDRGAPLFQPWQSPPAVRGRRAILEIEIRPKSRDLLAWSRERGAVRSTNAGRSWSRLELNPAFHSALRGSLVDAFAFGRGERLYLATRGFGVGSPNQLWRSTDDGRTWSSIASFPAESGRHPILLRRQPKAPEESLFLGLGDSLSHSTDGGSSWRAVSGPWEGGTIRTYRIDPAGHTVVFNVPHATRAAFAERLRPDDADIRALTLVWPDGEVRPRSDIRDATRIEDFLFLMTDRNLYAGRIPHGASRLPNAPAIIATVVFVIALAGLSFWYLRFHA